jgi:hypothetical protein
VQTTVSESGRISKITGEQIGTNKYAMHVVSEAAGVAWDSVTATYPTTSSEVYTYTLSGVTTRVVTVTYTDATKAVLTSIVRS